MHKTCRSEQSKCFLRVLSESKSCFFFNSPEIGLGLLWTINRSIHLTTEENQKRKTNKGVVKWLSFSCLYLWSAVIWLLTEPSQPTLTHYITWELGRRPIAAWQRNIGKTGPLPSSSKVSLSWTEQYNGTAAHALCRTNLECIKSKGVKKESAYRYNVGPENALQSTAMQNPCLV